MNNDWIECLHWLCVSILASPFGWEVGPLGLGGGELACGGVWPCAFGAVLFAWCVGLGGEVGGQSWFESEFPPSVRLTPATFPQGGRLWRLCFLGCWRIIDIKKAPTPLCGCLIGNLYVPKDTAYSVGRQSRLFYFAQFFL